MFWRVINDFLFISQLGEGEAKQPETQQQKYQRIQQEIRELAEEVNQIQVRLCRIANNGTDWITMDETYGHVFL